MVHPTTYRQWDSVIESFSPSLLLRIYNQLHFPQSYVTSTVFTKIPAIPSK